MPVHSLSTAVPTKVLQGGPYESPVTTAASSWILLNIQGRHHRPTSGCFQNLQASCPAQPDYHHTDQKPTSEAERQSVNAAHTFKMLHVCSKNRCTS